MCSINIFNVLANYTSALGKCVLTSIINLIRKPSCLNCCQTLRILFRLTGEHGFKSLPICLNASVLPFQQRSFTWGVRMDTIAGHVSLSFYVTVVLAAFKLSCNSFQVASGFPSWSVVWECVGKSCMVHV